MYDFVGKTVLITGSSGGIGAAMATQLAQRGAHLVLVARSRSKLEELARTIEREARGRVSVIPEDLSTPGAAQRLRDAVTRAGLAIDVLINNAGVGNYGAFEALKLTTHREVIDLNVTALVELTYLFLPELLERRGGVIQVASAAAFQPVPNMAVYAASKAFVLSFSEALWGEYRQRGLHVLCLCPGATDTAFFTRAGEGPTGGKKADPQTVARIALDTFGTDRSYVIPGFGNWLLCQSSRFMPRATTARLMASMVRSAPPEKT